MKNASMPIESISAKSVLLTPQECAELLKNNDHNRRPSSPAIKSYASQMRSGQWRLNGEPVIIADNGDILDGQHRLYACIEAGVPFNTLIVFNVPRDTFSTIDTGKTRSGADVLTIEGMSPEIAKHASTVAGFAILFEKGLGIKSGGPTQHLTTPARRAEWVNGHPRAIHIIEEVAAFGRTGRVISVAEASFLWFFMEKIDPDSTYEFFKGFLSGANLGELDPRLAARIRIESYKNSVRSLTITARIGIVIRAWDWFRRGRKAIHPGNMTRDLESAIDLIRGKSK